MTFRTPFLPLVVALALLVGCSRDAASSSTPATAASAPTAAAVSASTSAEAPSTPAATPSATSTPAGVQVERVMAHIRALAGDIGVRAAGTEGERAAARYIEGALREAGYATAIEPFTFTTTIDNSAVTLAGGATVPALLFGGSGIGSASGVLVDAGTGTAPETAAARLSGAVALVRRGGLPFSEKAANARAAGAVAVIIVNNEPGSYRGTLGSSGSSVPVVGVSGADGPVLLGQIGQTVSVTASAGRQAINSQNVVGRNGDCRAYVGGHYDSVAQAPGANDNASGTATALELARVHRVGGLCFIAFGAEEAGLRGSQAFVSQHPVAGTLFVLNFDMTGRLGRPLVVGDEGLTATILGTVGQSSDPPLRAGTFPPFASSDHVSFVAAGVPAVTFYAGDDPVQHTARDEVGRIQPESLLLMLQAGDSVLNALTGTLAAR